MTAGTCCGLTAKFMLCSGPPSSIHSVSLPLPMLTPAELRPCPWAAHPRSSHGCNLRHQSQAWITGSLGLQVLPVAGMCLVIGHSWDAPRTNLALGAGLLQLSNGVHIPHEQQSRPLRLL